MNQIETFFDTMAERWDAVCVHDPGKIRTILDRSNLRQNARILDVGEISGSSAHRVPPRGRYELRGERIRLYYPV